MPIINPLLAAIKAGTAPKLVKVAAARGALPIPPDILLEAQVILAREEDQDIRNAALQGISSISETDVLTVLENRDIPAEVLGFCAEFFLHRPAVVEKIILNPSTPHSAFIFLSPKVSQSLADLVINNQVRLIECPEIIRALRMNGQLTPGSRKRLEEIEHDFLSDAPPAQPSEGQSHRPATQPADALAAMAVDEVASALSRDDLEALIREEDTVPSPEQADFIKEKAKAEPERVTIYQRIASLPVSEKIKLALIGNREERSLLIRDSNRLVATSVLASPKITDSEAELISQMRNVSDEVLRLVGGNKEWRKNYRIALNLVKNPRTPLRIVLPLLGRLNGTDLKLLEKDRTTRDAVRQQLRRLLSRQQ